MRKITAFYEALFTNRDRAKSLLPAGRGYLKTVASTARFPKMLELELFAQETNDMIGLHHAHHATLGIHHGERVQVVLIEDFS